MSSDFPSRRQMLVALPIAPYLVLGCAGPSIKAASDRYVSPDFRPPKTGSIILVLHLPALEPVYRVGDEEIRKLVQASLFKAGYRVGVIEPEDYMLALRAEFQQLRRTTPAPTPEQLALAEMQALSTVAKVGSELTGSPVLLRTRLLTRSANLWQSYATWDGVSRPIVFADSKPNEVRANIEGTGSGISLEVVATSSDGRLLLKNYGGISLPFYASRSGRPLTVDKPLAVQSHLAQGVAIALSPFYER